MSLEYQKPIHGTVNPFVLVIVTVDMGSSHRSLKILKYSLHSRLDMHKGKSRYRFKKPREVLLILYSKNGWEGLRRREGHTRRVEKHLREVLEREERIWRNFHRLGAFGATNE